MPNTIHAQSLNLSVDVQPAIDSANDGDTVVLPPGSASWNAVCNISKSITVIGAGPDYANVTPGGSATIIQGPGNSQGQFFNYTANNNGYTAYLGGFVVDLTQQTNNSYVIAFGGISVTRRVSGVISSGFVLRNIRFRSSSDVAPYPIGGKSTLIRLLGYLSGSIDHCFIDYNLATTGAEIFDLARPGSLSSATSTYGEFDWQLDCLPGGDFDWDDNGALVGRGLGTRDFRTYVEDNIWNHSGVVHDTTGGGGFFVERHNTTRGAFGGHGMESGNNMGPAFREQYNNNIIGNTVSPTPPYVGSSMRGGRFVKGNERMTGYSLTTRAPTTSMCYRMSASSSGVVGPADGTCGFDKNERGVIHYNGRDFTPVTTQNSGNPGTPSDTRLGSVYFQNVNESLITNSATVTISAATPGVVTWTGHGLSSNDVVYFTTTGTLPHGLSPNVGYYVLSPTTDTFQLAASISNSAIGTTGTPAQSGTHTAFHVTNPYVIETKNGTSGTKYTLKGLSSADGDLLGFCVRDLALSPDESLIGQGVLPGTATTAYALITSSTSNGPDTDVITAGAANGEFSLNAISKWELRRVKQAFCITGSGKLLHPLNGGNNKNGVPVGYVGGVGLPVRWDNNDGGFGIWYKNVLFRKDNTLPYTEFTTLGVQNQPGLVFVAGGLNNSFPAGFPTGLTDPNTLRIGADWTRPGAPTFGQPGCESYVQGDADAVGGANDPTGTGIGGTYPNALVTLDASTGPLIALSGNMTFGNVIVGQTPTSVLTITNVGDSDLIISGVTYPTGYSGANYSGTISALGHHDITVTFTPVAANTDYNGNITVSSNIPDATKAVTGHGSPPPTSPSTSPEREKSHSRKSASLGRRS